MNIYYLTQFSDTLVSKLLLFITVAFNEMEMNQGNLFVVGVVNLFYGQAVYNGLLGIRSDS